MSQKNSESVGERPILDIFSEPFEVEVDYDNPRWQAVDPSEYGYCTWSAIEEEFPMRYENSRRTIRCAWLHGDTLLSLGHVEGLETIGLTSHGVLAVVRYQGLFLPDRMIAETVLDGIDMARKAKLWPVCVLGTNNEVHGYVGFGQDGERRINRTDYDFSWNRTNNFLVVLPD